MFGTAKRLDSIEQSIRNELHDKDWRIQQLQREVEDLKSWGKKWREKAKYLRRKNRQLREQLEGPTP